MTGTMEEKYRDYCAREDKTRKYGNYLFYKIVNKEQIVKNEIITIPNAAVMHEGKSFIDENGDIFRVGSIVHYSFNADIPRWYLETITFVLEDISVLSIGKYIRQLDKEGA